MYSEFILNTILSTKCQSYLELGLYHGETISKIYPHVKTCVGVDIINVDIPGIFCKGTTDEFFEYNKNKITFDAIFIDADHRFSSVKRDLENSLQILNENGIIFLHDTDPDDTYLLKDEYCSDSFKIIDFIFDTHPELNVVTLPIINCGLSIVNRKKDRRVLKLI